MASLDSTLSLTFGIELEFLLAYLPQAMPASLIKPQEESGSSQEQYEYIERVFHRNTIRTALLKAGLDVSTERERNYQKWIVHQDASVTLTDEDLTGKVSLWADGQETELTEEMRGHYRYVDVEIISPIFKYDGLTIAFPEIERVVDVITKGFPVITPRTSGLHIHVGNEAKGFPLRTLKNLAILTHCFENRINQIHPACRLQSPYCILPRLAFEPEDRNPQIMAEGIDTLKDIPDFVRFFGTERNCRNTTNNYRAYNFGNLGKNMSKQTIEFRQHKGTLNMDEIQNWVNTTNQLVSLAHNSDSADIVDLVLNKGYDTDFTLVDLFSTLGFKSLADYYGPRLHDHSKVIIPDFFAKGFRDSNAETEIEIDLEEG